MRSLSRVNHNPEYFPPTSHHFTASLCAEQLAIAYIQHSQIDRAEAQHCCSELTLLSYEYTSLLLAAEDPPPATRAGDTTCNLTDFVFR